MAYHSLSESTLSDDERWNEKNKIVKIIQNDPDVVRKISENELRFVNRMFHSPKCSVRELFWLRDIKDKLI